MDFFRKSLFVVGEFGGNDYSFTMKSGRTVDQVKGMVPTVVDAICAAVEVHIYQLRFLYS
jgi:hypothetical protein